jgi:lipid-A-disaccharide synthase
LAKPLTIFVSAAEASGDEHAARLMRSLRRRLGEIRFVGVAGANMEAEGCEVLADFTKEASMLGGPILRLGYYLRAIRRLQRQIAEIRPDMHVPVDSPAMNWHLAAAAKKSGSPVVYYIAPQVWAWAPWRVRKLARLTDRVACILPFEERYLRDRGVRAEFVGHPLFDALPPRPDPLPDIAEAWSEGNWRVAVLPGSRPGEIRHNMPALLVAAEAIRRRWPAARCVLAARTEEDASAIRAACPDDLPPHLEIAVSRTVEVLSGAHFALAKSGTNTLQAAWFGVPMVTFYRASRFERAGYRVLSSWLIRTPHFALVNLLAGRRVVPEIMPWSGSPRQLTDMVIDTMTDFGYLFQARRELIEVIDELRQARPGSASDNAADLVARTLGR